MREERHPGVGAMLGLLGGNEESVFVFRQALGKTITGLRLGDDDESGLHLTFVDGSKIKLYDAGQSCCEARYMRTDDHLDAYLGAKLLGAEVRDAPDIEDEYGVHEVQFLVVHTSVGALTCSSHNEHNGYYAGFLIRAAKE